jgi:hypothetical protein
MKGIDSVMRNPYLKPMRYCLLLLFGILFLAGCSDNSGFLASWEYDLGVENLTSHEYLSATMIQLNNIMSAAHVVIDTVLIRKDSMERLRIYAEDDEDKALFAVFVTPCKENGAPIDYPTKSYFLSAFPYKMFRDPEGAQIKKIQIRDEDLNEVSISDFPSFAQPEFTVVE